MRSLIPRLKTATHISEPRDRSPDKVDGSYRYFLASARTFVSKCDDVTREPGK